MSGEVKTLTDHDEIKRWAEKREGNPATIAPEGMVGILKINFPGPDKDEEKMREISWAEFFNEFEEKNLALIIQGDTEEDGKSNYYQFVKREPKSMEETKAKLTIDPGEIKKWANERGAIPASIKGTEDEGEVAGILTFDFSGDPKLETLSWDEFMDKFNKEKLAFLYREKDSSGEMSKFFEFENRV